MPKPNRPKTPAFAELCGFEHLHEWRENHRIADGLGSLPDCQGRHPDRIQPMALSPTKRLTFAPATSARAQIVAAMLGLQLAQRASTPPAVSDPYVGFL
jgi:hypothetical protein